jgi:hypothetical protein
MVRIGKTLQEREKVKVRELVYNLVAWHNLDPYKHDGSHARTRRLLDRLFVLTGRRIVFDHLEEALTCKDCLWFVQFYCEEGVWGEI